MDFFKKFKFPYSGYMLMCFFVTHCLTVKNKLQFFSFYLFFLFTISVATTYYWILVDEHDKPLPNDPLKCWYYNATGGNRGILHIEEMDYKWDGERIICAVSRCQGMWTWGGMFYCLNHDKKDNYNCDFNAIFGPYIKPEYQGRIIGIQIRIAKVVSARNNKNLILKVELKKAKNESEELVFSYSWPLKAVDTPTVYDVAINSATLREVHMLLCVIDRAIVGDTVSIENVKLRTEIPNDPLKIEDQAFLWSFYNLINNYDSLSGLVQDRSNFPADSMENITATAKAAKCAYYAYAKGFCSKEVAFRIASKICSTFIYTLLRGPTGKNSLWPHFTRNRGKEILGGNAGEWPSGDCAYAALDLIATLEMFGDSLHQKDSLEAFLKNIDWEDMINKNNQLSHGYYDSCKCLILYYWSGFGMENIGVNWAYASVYDKVLFMDTPPTDNGSGFIENAHYPMVLSGKDRWGNDWTEYRNAAAEIQINWYKQNNHYNKFFAEYGLFGLSAAEPPDVPAPPRQDYFAYGTGGKGDPLTGDDEVVVLHYSAMISDIRPEESKRMWQTLRDREADFLADKIIISPWNNMESMRVNKNSGAVTVNYLKGSWNLSLQAEGWALADSLLRLKLRNAINKNSFLKKGYEILTYSDTTDTTLSTLSQTNINRYKVDNINIGLSLDQITIIFPSFLKEENTQISLYSINGKKVLELNEIYLKDKINISTCNLARGVYQIVIKRNKNSYKKIFILL